MTKISDKILPGVATGDDVQYIFKIAKENQFALPAVNVVGTNSTNAVLEAAAKVNSPVIIQFSNGGGAFNAGKSDLQKDGERIEKCRLQCHLWHRKIRCGGGDEKRPGKNRTDPGRYGRPPGDRTDRPPLCQQGKGEE